ncbi:MAG: UDP-N-acetylglucosamine--N-acetylmuramyl-(pentapeptide) pyrophosphoryl-undecaprenol N-acetylglucosamine transferase, partial [Treponema sp.]|nr:UDP-N-acetylglucosamine--N-acetylmuramyl-(pentapeptide) pyrophosphoryl-undecaprenol N-acetylglucosamine transferase [Treponema sp.]
LNRPMVLIPLCGKATRGDQVDNALYFEKNGAAITLNGKDADREHLIKALESMAQREKRESCSAACRKILPAQKPASIIANLLYNSVV